MRRVDHEIPGGAKELHSDSAGQVIPLPLWGKNGKCNHFPRVALRPPSADCRFTRGYIPWPLRGQKTTSITLQTISIMLRGARKRLDPRHTVCLFPGSSAGIAESWGNALAAKSGHRYSPRRISLETEKSIPAFSRGSVPSRPRTMVARPNSKSPFADDFSPQEPRPLLPRSRRHAHPHASFRPHCLRFALAAGDSRIDRLQQHERVPGQPNGDRVLPPRQLYGRPPTNFAARRSTIRAMPITPTTSLRP